MGIRFDKVLEQVAGAGSPKGDASLIEKREHKVQRIEELIRNREAVGDRIVMCLGLALTLSAIALPVYAVHFSEGYTYLQSAGSSVLGGQGSTTHQARAEGVSPATTGSLAKQAKSVDAAGGATSQGADRRAQFQRYVIHRATSDSALIEGPEGLWWATPGMTLPGIGQIISIERSDSGWVVLTSETMITQPPVQRPAS
jgi:hypothetical protein